MSTKFLSPGWRMPRNANQSKSSNYSLKSTNTNVRINISSPAEVGITSSFSFWLKRTSNTAISQPYRVVGNGLYGMYISSSAMYVRYGGAAITINNTATLNAIALTDWVHWVITRQEVTSTTQDIRLYANGSLVYSLNGTSGLGTLDSKIDSLMYQLQATDFMNSFSVFDYSLSPSQVTTLWGGGTSVSNPMALPSPPIAYYPLGTSAWNGEYLAENNAIGDYVFDFDGVNDVVNITNSSEFNLGTSFTISGWFNFSSNKYQGLISFDSSSTRGWFLYQLNDNSIRLYDGTNAFTLKTSYTNTNQWDNFILNYNGTSLVFYINGLQESTQNVSINLQTNGNDGQIGNNQAGSGRYFNGKMSNVQIFNTALSSTEVETLYNNGSPIRTLANIPQSSNLKAWYKLDASEVYNSSTTEWIVGDSSGNYPTSLSFVKKANGSGNAITIYQGTDGNGPSNLKFGASDSFSISTWVYLNTRNSDKYIFTARGSFSAGAQRFNRLAAYPNGVDKQLISWTIRDDNNVSAGVNTTLATSGHPDDFVWANVVAVTDRSAQTIQIFVNGVGSPTTNISSLGGFQNQDSIVIGNDGYTAQSGRYYYEGQLSNLAIFDKALTQSEINTLYNGGTPEVNISHSPVSWWKLDNLTTGLQDSAGGGNNATAASWITKTNNNVSTLAGISSGMSQANLVQSNLQTVAPYSKYALDFDGTNDYIDLNFQSQTTPATISIWVNTDVNDSQQRYAIINGRADQQPAVYLRMQSDNTYQVFISNTNGFDTLQANSATVNTWFHFAIVCENSQTLLYENGTLKDSSTIGWSGIDIDQSNNWQLGRDSRGQRYWNGSISNVSIWNTAFTSSQVTEIYNEGLPSNLNSHSAYSNLVSWWQLGENSSFDGNDWIVADEKGSNNGTSTGMPVGALTNGVGTTANGVSSGMSEGNLVGDAPYSTANAISSNMVVTSRVTGSGNTP